MILNFQVDPKSYDKHLFKSEAEGDRQKMVGKWPMGSGSQKQR